MGSALRGRPSWDQFDDMTTMALRDAGAMLWEKTDLTPADVDVADLPEASREIHCGSLSPKAA